MTAMALSLSDYAQRILTARVYDVAVETPLDPMPRLSERLARTVMLKREDLQPVFSFKLRGAYNKIVRLPATERKLGVICASAAIMRKVSRWRPASSAFQQRSSCPGPRRQSRSRPCDDWAAT